MYLFLPNWPIDRLRRLQQSANTTSRSIGVPADPGTAPFATIVAASGRRLLAAVNRQAAAAGLTPGMPLADALAFLPNLATRDAEPAADIAALARLAEWCHRYSPWTAPDGGNGIKIEITGCAHLWGGEAQLSSDLAERLTRQGIGHRVAIAGTLGAAWALARFAADSHQPALPAADDERTALAPLPVEALRLDPATSAGLHRVGLRQIGDLYLMPRDALARRFGEAVAGRLDQALGVLPEPLSPLGEAPVRRVRLSFAEPISDPADFSRAIERLADDLVTRLAREGMGARRLDLAFHRLDGRVEHIRLGTAQPSRDPRHLAKLLAMRLDMVEVGGAGSSDDPGGAVEDVILTLFATDPLPPEQPGFTNDPHAAVDSLAPLLDRIAARLGPGAVVHIGTRESHIPEHASFYAAVGDRPAAAAPPVEKPPRPVRLFTPPEPIEAIWELPDEPPVHFTWRRLAHRVSHADGPERIAEEWWRDGGTLAADAIRDYYRVEDAAGRRFWLFRSGLPGDPPPRWFVHGLFA
jgi:protein ImuB